MKALLMYGTRPEAIKMAPLVQRLRDDTELEPLVVSTGQHVEMLAQVHGVFGITVDRELEVFEHGQDLGSLSSRVIVGATSIMRELAPDVVVVQGDTSSACMAGLAAFYLRIPVVHVEAGLRTGNPLNPFPEEMNRALLGRLSGLHLAPTARARDNLLREGVAPESICVTGNTVIDALLEVLRLEPPVMNPHLRQVLTEARDAPGGVGRSIVTVTSHRRESWGKPMRQVFGVVDALARTRPDCDFVLPLHPNPLVRDAAREELEPRPNVHVLDPLCYTDFCRLMAASRLILTDSGGVQEEAPSIGVPVLVLRETTERPEAVDVGAARLVGTDPVTLRTAIDDVLRLDRTEAPAGDSGSPFGDGAAATRCALAIRAMLGLGEWPSDFGTPSQPRASINLPRASVELASR